MALFKDDQVRDIREYLFQLEEKKRYKILQVMRILEDAGENEDTVNSAMYHLCKNEKEIDTVFSQLTNSSLIVNDFEQ